MGLGFMIWVLNLVRRGRLYVGYGVIFVVAILGTMVTLSVPHLLMGITHLVGAIFPASALTLLALAFIVIMLLYILSQLTLVSNRLAILIQELAIERAKDQARFRSAEQKSTSPHTNSSQ
jgi:hypothetical protein